MKRHIKIIGMLIIFASLAGIGCGGRNDVPPAASVNTIKTDTEEALSIKEEAPLIKEKTTPTKENTLPTKEKRAWVEAYQNYIARLNEKEPDNKRGFALIYLNGDEIPELLVRGFPPSDEQMLCAYDDGKIQENPLGISSSLGFEYEKYFYLEKLNLLLTLTGEQDGFQHTVYTMERGKIKEKAVGSVFFTELKYYAVPDFAGFRWDDTEVSRDDYIKELNQAFYNAGDYAALKGITEDRWYFWPDIGRALTNRGRTEQDRTEEKTITPEPEEPPKIKDWQQAYADYINLELKFYAVEEFSYSLIYLDEDPIPELHVSGGNMAGGQRLCSFYQGEVYDSGLSRGLYSYIKGSGLLYNPSIQMGYGNHVVYRLEEGILKPIARGEERETAVSETEWPYAYTWEGEDVSAEEFKEHLNEVYFDLSDEEIGIYEDDDDFDQWFSECAILTEICHSDNI